MFLKLAIFTVCVGVALGEIHPKALNQRSSDEQFDNEALVAHNNYRARHGLPPLVLNATISAVAQSWAEHLAELWRSIHSYNPNYGENLFRISSSSYVNGSRAVDLWYSEIDGYKFDKEPFDGDAGHFTQIVWRNTQQIGVGKARKNKNVFVVVNYYPPGNVDGSYVANVPPPTN